jgi:hypothetical protein
MSSRGGFKTMNATIKMINEIKMQNIEADPRDQAILDPMNMSDEQFSQFCAGDSPLCNIVEQFDAEQQVIGLLKQERPSYSLAEFEEFYQAKLREADSVVQDASEASGASTKGGGRP